MERARLYPTWRQSNGWVPAVSAEAFLVPFSWPLTAERIIGSCPWGCSKLSEKVAAARGSKVRNVTVGSFRGSSRRGSATSCLAEAPLLRLRHSAPTHCRQPPRASRRRGIRLGAASRLSPRAVHQTWLERVQVGYLKKKSRPPGAVVAPVANVALRLNLIGRRRDAGSACRLLGRAPLPPVSSRAA